MANQSGTITSTEGWRSIYSTPNDSITFTVVSGTYSVEYPVGTLAISGATSTQTLTLTNGGQMRVAVTAGSLTYALTDGADSYSLTQAEVAATQALLSAAWSSANSGAWLPTKFGAIPRLMASGGASGGTYTVSYRNLAQVVTTDDIQTTAANAADVSPLYIDDALELSIAVTGTVTAEIH
jgi:hypothetical protein